MIRFLILILLISLPSTQGFSQGIKFEYNILPKESGFKMEGYWVWGGSMIKVGKVYHLFASRWIKTGPFPEGYRQCSEIVRSTSRSPLGPFKFEEVVIGERDSSFWDSNMAHNPTIHKIGNEYVLFYIGSDFTTYGDNLKSLLRRVGYASSKKIEGPWQRANHPLINTESNNPAVLIDRNQVKLLYRDAGLKIFLATSTNYKGPFKVVNENVWPECKLEDFYMFKANHQYHIVCEDNVGGVSGHERWGVHVFSTDGITNWLKYDPIVVYDHDLIYEDNPVVHLVRRERPQLLITNGRITHLINGVYDGTNSWCQPVELKHPIKVEVFP